MTESTLTPPEDDRCLNCGQVLIPGHHFCSKCGQKRQPLKRTIRAILEDVWESTVAVDSKFVKTISNLLFRPGKLTREYFEGHRVTYLKPASLFLLAAALLFLSIEWTAATRESEGLVKTDSEYVSFSILPGFAFTLTGQQVNQIRDADDDELASILFTEEMQVDEFERLLAVKAMKLIRDDGILALRQKFSSVASKTVFLLVPLMALLVMGLHLRRKLYFADAIIYCLHFHAAGFLAYLILIAMPDNGVRSTVALPIVIYLFWYTTKSLRVAFDNSWFLATMKTGLLLLSHGLVALTLTIALIIAVLVLN
ncbi:MAG: DUF3667 domain-containing protein [Aureliella sp.]